MPALEWANVKDPHETVMRGKPIGGLVKIDSQHEHRSNHHHHSHADGLSSLQGAPIGNHPHSELIRRDISFRRITSAQDPALDSFVGVYQDAFGGAPYYEKFDAQFVREKVWQAHQGQLILVAEEKGKTIGLLCAHRVSEGNISPSACGFIKEQFGPVLNDRGSLYFSELAVAPTHQRLGVGSVLVASALSWATENLISKFILRTAAEGSNSAGIFKKFGAQALPMTQEVKSAEAGGPESASNKRVYLAGDSDWHGDYLARLEGRVDSSIIDARAPLCHA